jgi:CheY-like chemotaxis protein
MLSRRRILLAEDDFLVAADLIAAFEAADGEVVGPASSVAEALAILATAAIDAAILDIQLSDGDVTRLAEQLLADGTPLVFHTASAVPTIILDRYGPVTVCAKPMASDRVVMQLARKF